MLFSVTRGAGAWRYRVCALISGADGPTAASPAKQKRDRRWKAPCATKIRQVRRLAT